MKSNFLYFVLPLVFVTTVLGRQTIYPPKGILEKELVQFVLEKKDKQEVEFAFDIHKVLLHKRNDLIWKLIREYPHKLQLLKSLWNLPLMITLGSIVWQSIINILPWHRQKYREITSECFIHGLRQAHLTELVHFFIQILNAQEPDENIKKLIQELRARGYNLRVASNIGRQIFLQLKEQLSGLKQNIFDLFDKDEQGMEGKTIDYTQNNIEKPNPEYYKEYLDRYNPDRSKLIIFIDDKLVNIPPATEQGFLGIHYNNIEQLRADLTHLGIL